MVFFHSLIPVLLQTEKRLDAAVLAQKGALSARRLLLEEAQGRQNDARGPHEAEGAGYGVHLRLLRPFGHPAHLPSPMLLAAPKSGHCAGALSERAVPGRQQDGRDHAQPRAVGRQEGVDQGGVGQPAEANV